MAAHRPFPPSSRRTALARSSGLHASSPNLVGALACCGTVLAVVVLGRVAAARVGAWISAACDGSATLPQADALVGGVLEIALPVLAAGALAAGIAHLGQTRALWLPRRRLANAPTVVRRAGRRASLDLVSAAVIGVVTLGWLWLMAPRLAALPAALTRSPGAGGLVLVSYLVALAIAWVMLGTIDALASHAELTGSLRMTTAEKRDDDRLASADPRWRARRAALAKGPSTRDAVAGASLVLLGDDTAVAIAWDPTHRPIPVRTATGRTARATQLLGLARRHSVPVHRDAELTASLVDGEGPVSETFWPRLAEIIAATRGRSR